MRRKTYLSTFALSLAMTITLNLRVLGEVGTRDGIRDEGAYGYRCTTPEVGKKKKKKPTPEELLQSFLPKDKDVLNKVNEQCKTYVTGSGYEDAKAITSAWINRWNAELKKLQNPPRWKMRVVEKSEQASDWGAMTTIFTTKQSWIRISKNTIDIRNSRVFKNY